LAVVAGGLGLFLPLTPATAETTDSILIYPSPSNGSITITGQNVKDAVIDVIDISGQLIQQKNASNLRSTIINNLSQGILIIEVYDKNSNLLTRKLVPVINP